ncbi:hypothetical protein [Paraburkholderia bannensis]|uniref:hypothetical protein n=1 Tax=Paraburkholderia bannensis TaxID=765414 RepID=UPI002ABE8D40|nr:hypothetical protein [Paraburkholderia bannensis]
MAYPILFRAILVSIVVLAGVVVLFMPSSDPCVERRRVALRTAGIGIVLLATVLLTVAALTPSH